MRATIRKSKRGFTLVELMIVVAIVGILAALAIYGVRRYILNSKTAEARNGIGQMSKDASTAYNREGMAASILAFGTSAGVSNRLCTSALLTSVPGTPDKIKGSKYQSSPADWAAGGQTEGWACVKFSMTDPQYYMYGYAQSGTSGATGESFTATAQGDLDGNGTLSTFSVQGTVQADPTSGAKVVTLAPNIFENLGEE